MNKTVLFTVFSLFLAVLYVSIYLGTRESEMIVIEERLIHEIEENIIEEVPSEVAEAINQYKLSGDGYHLLFEELALPNTLTLIEPPEITSNTKTDQVIREIAESRGYVLRRIALDESELSEAEPSQFLQRRAADDWKSLKTAAKSDGVTLNISSSFRDIDTQRVLFLNRLRAAGASDSAISKSQADNIVNNVLKQTAPPGYSRHHNGYTIDVKSTDNSVFAYSRGYTWMSKDNFANAKMFGYIPSYPDGAIDQGPNPEAWEFVWIGTEIIEEQIN